MIANFVARPSVRPISLLSSPSSPLIDFEDRRTWHPDGAYRPARASPRSASRLLPSKSYTSVLAHGVRFAAPSRVAICVRRKMRKEVLHALKRTAKGAGTKKRRNPYSGISC